MFAFRKILMLLVFTCGAIFLAGCGDSRASSRKEANAAGAGEARKVRTGRVELGRVADTVRATGSLLAQDRAVLSVKAPGRLEEMLVDLGSKVEQGQVLARIEKTDYLLRKELVQAALNEARAVLNEAGRSRERVRKLREQGIVPEAETEAVQAAFDVASTRAEQRNAELNQVEQQLKDTEIVAPFSGILEQRQASVGEFLNMGTPVVTLVRVDPIRLRLEVAEGDAARIRVGQEVLLSPEIFGSGQPRGRLHRVSPVISPVNRMLLVEADLPNPEGILRPGSFVEAEILVANREAVVIPAEALFTFAGLEKVVLVEEGKAKEAQIRTGKRSGKMVEVVSGLKAGQEVVLQPGNLRTGQEVLVAN